MATQLWFFIIVSLVVFNYLFTNILDYVNHRNWKDEIPNELKDFYNKEKYKTAKAYALSKNKIGLFSSSISFLFIMSLLLFNGYGFIDQLVSSDILKSFLPFDINSMAFKITSIFSSSIALMGSSINTTVAGLK